MQQVIAGTLKGRRLLTLPANIRGVRPTSSRVRGAIFDRLQGEVQGANVLDLFAGSGANAIEALSRGAKHATLVELQPALHQFQKRQMQALALGARTSLHRGDARQYLKKAHFPLGPFDLVLCDPPYAEIELYREVLGALEGSGALAAAALVVVERAARGQAGLEGAGNWRLERQRRHGDTELLFWRRESA